MAKVMNRYLGTANSVADLYYGDQTVRYMINVAHRMVFIVQCWTDDATGEITFWCHPSVDALATNEPKDFPVRLVMTPGSRMEVFAVAPELAREVAKHAIDNFEQEWNENHSN